MKYLYMYEAAAPFYGSRVVAVISADDESAEEYVRAKLTELGGHVHYELRAKTVAEPGIVSFVDCYE